MKNTIKIAKFNKVGDSFERVDSKEYVITYLKGLKPHLLRIVVNGRISKQTINLVTWQQGYKNQILQAISDLVNDRIKDKTIASKFVNINWITSVYNKEVIHNINQYLLDIGGESSRDKLTEFGLI